MRESKLRELEKFLEQDPSDSFTHYAIALEYAASSDMDGAIEKLKALITLDPKYVPAYQQLASYLIKLRQYRNAQDVLEKGIQVAGLAGDRHAQSEMQECLDELPA